MIRKLKYFKFRLISVVLPKLFKAKSTQLYINGRQVGNSTRLVDMFVQEFFINGKCYVYDHYYTRQASERVFFLVLDRLNREHHISKKDIILDRQKLIIKKNKNIIMKKQSL